jgi:hypothetical protein
MFDSYKALNTYMEFIDPSRRGLHGDLILFQIEFDAVAFYGIEGSVSLVLDLDHPLLQSGINFSGGLANGANIGIGIGMGYVRGDVEGFTPLTIDLNAVEFSPTIITDAKGLAGATLSAGIGGGLSLSSQRSWTLNVQAGINFFKWVAGKRTK